MKIKVLGPGCVRCQQLEKTAQEVVRELRIDATIEEVKDINKTIEYPILTTPGLVLNDNLVCSGRVPTKAEVSAFLTTALARQA